MRLRHIVAGLVAFGVLMVWLYALVQRLPYMDQVPVFDADATTSEAHMWARMWWDEGALNMWFSTPLSPRSVETPTLASRGLYESWPPGAFVPIYLVAKALGIEPSVPLVNWINTTLHGLIALAAALLAFNLARLNRFDDISSGLIGFGVSFPILLSRGLVYVFSQVYDVVTAVLIYTAVFILLETLFYGARSPRDKRIISVLQLVTIYLAFFVDWLSYTLFAFWIVSRFVAGRLGIEERLTLRGLVKLSLMPISAFSIYLIWRFFAPGSLAGTYGLSASLSHLGAKILERMNLTAESQISGFGQAFLHMHEDYYPRFAFPLIAVATLITLALLVVAFRRADDPSERRSIFATLAVLGLVLVPFYVHMLILYQHTFIHRWAITKAMFAYALIPFALLPVSIFVLLRQFADGLKAPWRRPALAATGLLLALCALFGAANIVSFQEAPFLTGRIDRDRYLTWNDIGRNTVYRDIVVSPTLQANPISAEVGAAYKLVHRASNFAEVDKAVDHVCGDINIVVALSKGSEPGEFGSREPAQVIDTGRIRLLKFPLYPGKAIGCP